MKRMAWLMLALLLTPLRGVVFTEQPLRPSAPAALHYLSPSNGGQFTPPTTTLALRLDGPINPLTLSPMLFSLVGSTSGPHRGQVQLADDGTTVIFKPSVPFTPGEHVSVTVETGLATQAGAVFPGLHSGFDISRGGVDMEAVKQALAAEDAHSTIPASDGLSAPNSTQALATHAQDNVTLPQDFPAYTITVPASGTAPGLLFLAPINSAASSNFLLIMDDTGEPVFWQRAGAQAFDFKRQPDGTLTYFDTANASFHVLDNTYHETRTIAAIGFTADIHELQMLPNGHALFLAYDPEVMDMTAFGDPISATVVGLVIQELDTNDNLVFQWTSWDHFLLADTYQPLTTTLVDYVHGNAVGLDTDGNLLLSSRHLSEITKIDHSTGDVIWRLGGKHNQFAFTDPDGEFSCQHDIRRLPNGNLTLFDNHNSVGCPRDGTFSRAVEYQIDENAKVVTNTWQYRNSPDNFAFATGSTQRLPDGHTFIGWGISHPNVTEVLTDGTKLFEMTLSADYFSYRAFRFPWAAVPYWSPTLVLTGTTTPTLYYSWNGATDVAAYEIYGGFGSQPRTLLGTQTRTGFEDHTPLVGVPAGFCAFRVRPIDHEGQPQLFSNVVYASTPCNGYDWWYPIISRH